MAVEGNGARSFKKLGGAALCMRQPANRLAGSISTAVAISAIIVGAYELVIASVYSVDDSRFFYGMRGMVTTAGQIAFIAALANAALIFAFLRKNFVILETVVCAAMTVYLFCVPTSISVLLGLAYNTKWLYMLWEVPRLVWYPFHISLIYCLLEEIRGNSQPTSIPVAPSDAGWLKNNLSRQGHAPISADELVLKVHGTKNHNVNVPATFTPSSCTTAAPVHLSCTPANGNPSGPLSSSEA